MRQADINRVVKAKEHLKAATTILSRIKWENCNTLEWELVKDVKEEIRSADMFADDVINYSENN